MRLPKISRASFDRLVKDILPTLRGGQACPVVALPELTAKKCSDWSMGIPGRTESSVFLQGQRDFEQVRK